MRGTSHFHMSLHLEEAEEQKEYLYVYAMGMRENGTLTYAEKECKYWSLGWWLSMRDTKPTNNHLWQ